MAGEDPKKRAFKQGQSAAQVTGPDSQHVYSPYDPDTERELYEAWDDGFNHGSDIRSEMIHFGA